MNKINIEDIKANLIGEDVDVLEHENVFDFTGTIDDVKIDTDGSVYLTVAGADDYFVDVSLSNIEITKDNIHLYYEFMSDEDLKFYDKMLNEIFRDRTNLIIEKINFSNMTNKLRAYMKYTASDYYSIGTINEVYLNKSRFHFGIKDTLKPIDEYIAEIEESDLYQEFLFNKVDKFWLANYGTIENA